jgi:hypothetical protein
MFPRSAAANADGPDLHDMLTDNTPHNLINTLTASRPD